MKYSIFLGTLALILINTFLVTAQHKDWVNEPPISKKECFRYFVSKGSGPNEEIATQNAQENVTKQLIKLLGTKIASTEIKKKIESIADNSGISVTQKIEEIIRTSGTSEIKGITFIDSDCWFSRNIYTCAVLARWEACEYRDSDPFFSYRQAGARAYVPMWGQLYKKQPCSAITILLSACAITAGYVQLNSVSNFNERQAILNNNDQDKYNMYIGRSNDAVRWSRVMLVAYVMLYGVNVIDAKSQKGYREYAKSNIPIKLQPYYAGTHIGLSATYSIP